MLLSRTRAEFAYRARLALFKAGRIQRALDESQQRVLETHMGFRGQWVEHRRFQLHFLKSIGLAKDSRLLEIGCGPLTLGLPAIEFLDPNRYTGIDVRAEVLDLAWSQIGRSGLASRNPRLLHSTSFGAAELGDERFDFIWAFSVVFHLTDELVDALFARISHCLAPGGVGCANINIEHNEGTWLQFPFMKRDVDFYRRLAERNGMKVTELGTLASLGFGLQSSEGRNVLLSIERR
jgi:2-polyprenyl-3-methyl-5-hydroxy-6-metoxy-1,4-benzoquinol methylase